MIRGIYDAAAGMNAAMVNHEVVAHNIAHANVPGYRQQGLKFRVPDAPAASTGSAAGAPSVGTPTLFIDFRPGPVQFTGAPLDLAIDGDAFFVLNGPSGPVYTRNGAFRLTPDGTIVSQSGYPLQGDGGGPLTIPADAGAPTITRDGTLSAGRQLVGQVALVRFQDLTKLTPVGPANFSAALDAGTQPATGSVLQGFREGSNVQAAEAMVAMITGARQFEAFQRTLRAFGDSIQLNTRPQG